MFIPEYSYSSQAVRHLTTIDYLRGICEGKNILPLWEKEFRNEVNISNYLLINDIQNKVKISRNDIIDSINKVPSITPIKLKNYILADNMIRALNTETSIDVRFISYIFKTLSGEDPSIRQEKITTLLNPQEIIAEIEEFSDWLQSIDSKEAHPIVTNAIMLAHIYYIAPFKGDLSIELSILLAKNHLKNTAYKFNQLISIENIIINNIDTVHNLLNKVYIDNDYTKWIDFYTKSFALEAGKVSEFIKLKARETKVAVATGYKDLNERQVKLIRYLQDYGKVTNKNFAKLFPNISEDTVLREIKDLIDKDIIEKKGKTKSSRYVLISDKIVT
jgi:hypothetical protein